jgi:hypothetical protein
MEKRMEDIGRHPLFKLSSYSVHYATTATKDMIVSMYPLSSL